MFFKALAETFACNMGGLTNLCRADRPLPSSCGRFCKDLDLLALIFQIGSGDTSGDTLSAESLELALTIVDKDSRFKV